MDHPVEPTNYKVFDCLVNKTWFFLPHFGCPFIVSLGSALFAQSCLQMVAISCNGRRGYLRGISVSTLTRAFRIPFTRNTGVYVPVGWILPGAEKL